LSALRVATRQLFERLRDDTVDVDAEFVVAPRSIEDAAEVLAVAVEAGAPVSFYGAGTHRDLGSPVDADVVITSSAMKRIIDYEPDDLTVRVDPGVTLGELDEVLADRRLTAVLPETEPEATIGGFIATGRSGFRRLRHGPTRDRVLQVTAATGYGKVITGGSPVVKSSTGYGMPRLFTGSLGSLGMIGPVLLKLWSEPMATATVVVEAPEAARLSTYRPLAVLGTAGLGVNGTGGLYLGGTPEEVEVQAEALGGEVTDTLDWPGPQADPLRLSFRVPARLVADAVARAENLGASSWIAQYGVGLVEAGYQGLSADGFTAARAWSESAGGSLVIEAAPADLRAELGTWGAAPDSVGLQREIKQRFDPAGICNPGILPGGV
jgi:glycolate oxidase FAD binding subunit